MVEMLRRGYSLLDQVQVAFVIADVHSRIFYVNRHTEYLFGYERAEMEGERIRLLFLEEDLTYFLPNIIYLALYKNGFQGDALLKQKNGAKVFVRLNAVSFKEEGELFVAFSFQEIQRLKSLEREMGEHWVSLGRMVEEIAHQLRNPIVSIGGYTNRLLKILPAPQKGRSYLVRVQKETKRLEALMQQVEEYIRIPRFAFQKERIQEVVEEALQTFSEESGAKGVSIGLEIKSLQGEGTFFIDRGQIIKALSHILKNSAEAMTPISMGRTRIIKVAIFEDEESLGISISDKGKGIRKKDLGHIFEPFFSTRPDRVGLGLTFVRRAVEKHGGKIEAESRPGKGTTISLSFPKDRHRRVRREWISPEVTQRIDPGPA